MDAPNVKVMDDSEIVEDYIGADDQFDSKVSPLSLVLGIVFCPMTVLCSWFSVQEQEEVVTLNYGKYTGTIKEPGIHFKNCFGREMRRISKRKISVDLPITKIVDKNGNPLMISGIVVYSFVNSKKSIH